MENVVQLNIREVMILIGAFASVIGFSARHLLKQFDRLMKERFKAMEKQQTSDKESHVAHMAQIEARQTSLDRHVTEVQRSMESLARDMPLQYVRREDWIRFGASIDAKLDRLTDAVHLRNLKGNQ